MAAIGLTFFPPVTPFGRQEKIATDGNGTLSDLIHTSYPACDSV